MYWTFFNLSKSSSVRNRTDAWSRYSARLMRRAPLSCIPRQFLKLDETSW